MYELFGTDKVVIFSYFYTLLTSRDLFTNLPGDIT